MTKDLANLERLRQRLPERRDPFVNLLLSRSSHFEVEEEIAERGVWGYRKGCVSLVSARYDFGAGIGHYKEDSRNEDGYCGTYDD
jgi:hypothetical protein